MWFSPFFLLQHDLSVFAKCYRRPGEDKLMFIQMLQNTSNVSNRMCLNLTKHYMVNFIYSLDRLKDHILSMELPWALLAQISAKPYLHRKTSLSSQIHTAGIGRPPYPGLPAAETAGFSLSREKVGKGCTKRHPPICYCLDLNEFKMCEVMKLRCCESVYEQC